jgi:predicted transcriptional regulator of viral defense system
VKAIEAYAALRSLPTGLVQTRDVSHLLKMSIHAAGKCLERLAQDRLVTRIARGKWLIDDHRVDRLQIAEFIVAPQESYISLHSALFYHGMIEQVPTRTYSITLGRTKVIDTPLGTFSYHHCKSTFFAGFEYIKPYLKLATPEKALVDYLYFSPARSAQFKKLPELELPDKFSWKKAFNFAAKISSPRTKALVHTKLRDIESR